MHHFQFPIHIYYQDTDAGGIVYHSKYLDFAERARADMLHKAGYSVRSLLDNDIGFIIRHVDMFVIESVCKLLKTWISEGKEIPISVNLSRVTLQEYGIVDSIVEICDRYQIPHHLLVVEVTERIGLIENDIASALIETFKSHGFHISLDDFGCAYSNIITLAQIEVDEVKIDKSLVDHIITNPKSRILVRNIVSMCNELEGSATLAEGIETKEQAQLLHEFGCRLGQGYYYSRPLPVEEFYQRYIN